MKTIGMLGGMSWESSSVYYQLINREVQKRAGGVPSAKTLMFSFDFGDIAPLQSAGDWATANARMVEGVQALERGGADFLIMCCNTMHCATPDIEVATRLPFLPIADPLGAAARPAAIRNVGLLGSGLWRDSPAYEAGLRPGDVIVTFNGTLVTDGSQMSRLIQDTKIGSTAVVVLIRDGRKSELKIPIQRTAQ